MNSEKKPTPVPRSLANLDAVELNTHGLRLLEVAQAANGGPAPWRARKMAEIHDLAALAQVSGRFVIEWLDLADALRVVIAMRVPVPCRPDPHGPLQIAPFAQIGLTYRAEALRSTQPGTSFVEILRPRHVWLPNVWHGADGANEPQVLCLAGSVPAGIRTREILHMVFGALSLQTVQMDSLDPAGVLSREAAEWWQQPENLTRVPLTREPFLYTPEVKS